MKLDRKPRVFLSRTTAGLKATAARAAEILGERVEVIHQPDFYPSTHDVKGMLAEHLRSCDAVVCLVGPLRRCQGMKIALVRRYCVRWQGVDEDGIEAIPDEDTTQPPDARPSRKALFIFLTSPHGSGPTDPFTQAGMPVRGLKDRRTHDRLFSYTQLEFLIARDLPRRVYTLFIGDGELLADFPLESPELAARQQAFIADFAKDGSNT